MFLCLLSSVFPEVVLEGDLVHILYLYPCCIILNTVSSVEHRASPEGPSANRLKLSVYLYIFISFLKPYFFVICFKKLLTIVQSTECCERLRTWNKSWLLLLLAYCNIAVQPKHFHTKRSLVLGNEHQETLILFHDDNMDIYNIWHYIAWYNNTRCHITWEYITW